MKMKKLLFAAAMALCCVVGVNAQTVKQLAQVDLKRAKQTFGTVSKGMTVTGEEPKVAGVKVEPTNNTVGVHAPCSIALNLKGYSSRVSGATAVADNNIDYSASDISYNTLTDGTRLWFRTVEAHKQFAGVGGSEGKVLKGKALFKIIGDGRELYSITMSAGQSPVRFDIDVNGIKELLLVCDDAGQGISGAHGLWIDTQIAYDAHQAGDILCQYQTDNGVIEPAAVERLERKAALLPTISLPLQTTPYDWLIDSSRAMAGVYATSDRKSIVITNGLCARIFRLFPNLATTDVVNQMTGENMLRAVSGEGSLTIDGITYNLGGLDGQPERGYIKPEWIDSLTPLPNSFFVEDMDVEDSIPSLEWVKRRWALNKQQPTGKRLTFTLRGREAMQSTIVRLHFDIYDHLPAIRKSMEVVNGGNESLNIDSFKLEHLFFAEPESTEGDMSRNYMPNIHVESDFACGGNFWEYCTDRTEHWTTDRDYTSQCNYGNNTLCTLDVNPTIGPDQSVESNGTFKSFSVWQMPVDSYDRERKGLFKRRFYRTITPWATENPIFMHLTTIDPQTVKRAVDQCVETGYEMIILSFGSGMNGESTSPEHIAKIKSLVDYAKSKGIEMGGYSLLASRWVSDEVDVINPATGKRGGAIFGSAPCLCSDWGVEYLNNIKSFWQQTGLTLLEHDGSYPGDVCASTTHSFHRGLNDSQWNQFARISELYHWALANGVSLNVPDFYFMNGSTKVSIGYKEVNWSLPRDRQLIHGRQVNYSGTFDRMASMCWSFVPLVQYHGGGEAATLEPLSEHLKEYRQIMMQNYGAGIQACYRGPRLYDTDQTRQTVKEVIDWYKLHREILNSDMIHLRRADGRDWDGFVHVNPLLKERGLAMLFNPTDKPITRTIKLPLYYTGLTDKAMIRQGEGRAKAYKLARDYSVCLTVTIAANDFVWFVIE